MARSVLTILTVLLITSSALTWMPALAQEDAEALFSKALDLQNLGKLAEALPMYEKALEADPENYKALLATGLAAYGKGDYKKAAESLGKLLLYYPGDMIARTCLAYTKLHLGEINTATDSFWKILADDPSNAAAMIGLGWSEYLAGDRFSAVADLKKALALQPRNKALSDAIARLQDANKEFLEAEREQHRMALVSAFNSAVWEASIAEEQAAQSAPRAPLTLAQKALVLGLMEPDAPASRWKIPGLIPAQE
ncbi:MAG: tetratricopeptide repeat protein [Deltaproteobacteria bacterium]|nr:tetratricopeptide repeat protein [Deltaproteobacteria bacterium]